MNLRALGLALALLAGVVARMIWVDDMEWKLDEQIMYNWYQEALSGKPWQTLGMQSGVWIKNPGMSVWVFILVGRLFGATTPLELCRAVEILNSLAIVLLAIMAWKTFEDPKDRKTWLWGVALAAVNPFAIAYHRKIWAQSILPIFCVVFLWFWFRRRNAWGAFFWGFFGAILGQIHMSGFPYALGLVIWAFCFDRAATHWKGWFIGSCLGTIPLLNWFFYLWREWPKEAMSSGWTEAIQLKFWVFWLTDPLGLHLGNLVGVLNGNRMVEQLRDFWRYPLLGGQPTYGVAALHALLSLCGIWIFFVAARSLALRIRSGQVTWRQALTGRGSEIGFTLSGTLWGYGPVLTITGILIHRFYLIVTLPLEFVWLARAALSDPRHGQRVLVAVIGLEMLLSAAFLGYIHVNEGAPHGDYGPAYVRSMAILRAQAEAQAQGGK